MSSPLDGRIRALAREEAASMFATPATATGTAINTDQVAELQQQITDLHEHLHHATTITSQLEARVDALEAAVKTESAESISRRTRRKTTEG